MAETAAALRPFYFAVHPDLFGQYPKQRAVNEESLKHFNEYISLLHAEDGESGKLTPRKLTFYIRNKDKQGTPGLMGIVNKTSALNEVSIKLMSRDPHETVKTVLTACSLPLDYLDSHASSSPQPAAKPKPRRPTRWYDNYQAQHGKKPWEHMDSSDTQPKESIYARDLTSLGVDSKVYAAVNSFQDNQYIHIRVYLHSYANDGTMLPTKTGACLNVEEWESLLYWYDAVNAHISQVSISKGQMKVKPIQLTENSKYYISTSYWKEETKIHIRVFECDNGKLIPKKKGIALSVTEWNTLHHRVQHEL